MVIGMQFNETTVDGVTTVEPNGRIDLLNSGALKDRLVELIRSGAQQLLVDFRRVQYISSAGFRALLIARKLMHETAGDIVLYGMTTEIKRVFAIGTFTDLFTICATAEEALAKLR